MADHITYKVKLLRDFPAPEWEPEVAASDWEWAPCGESRDSDALTRANFDALCDRFDTVDPYGNDWEIVRFGHFAVGWVEQIFVRPASKVSAMCPEIREFMGGYPCLDEDLWSQYESDDSAGIVANAE